MINPPKKNTAAWPARPADTLCDCFDLVDQLDDIGDPDIDELFNYAQRAAAETFD